MNDCPSLQPLIDQLRALWASEPDIEQRMRKAKPLVERLITDPELREKTRNWPMTPRQNLLFYEDPQHGFVLNATVRVQGSSPGVPHDHAHAWTLYAICEGNESMERYEQVDDGSRPGHAELRLTSVTPGKAGDVDLIPPRSIHLERAGAERSSALILRSERLVGRTPQRLFNLEKQSVVEGQGPAQVPYAF